MAKMTTDQMVEQLKAAYGDALDAIVVYGSAARHGGTASSIDLLVIVRELAEPAMRASGAATRAWVEAGHPAPMILTAREWRAGDDIFAIEYADILASHQVLHGVLPIAGIDVTHESLRLQLERETMGKVLQLRRELQVRGGEAAALRPLADGVRGPSFALLRALLRAFDGTTSAHNDSLETAKAAALLTGIDMAPLARLVEHQRGTRKIDDKELPSLLRGVHDTLAQLADWLDKAP